MPTEREIDSIMSDLGRNAPEPLPDLSSASLEDGLVPDDGDLLPDEDDQPPEPAPRQGPHDAREGAFDPARPETGPGRPSPREEASQQPSDTLQTCGHPIGDLRPKRKSGKQTICASCDSLERALGRILSKEKPATKGLILTALEGWRPGPGSKHYRGQD